MTDETLTPPNIPEMLRTTGINTSVFMHQIAEHISKLEQQVEQLQTRITEMEAASGNSTEAQ